MRSGIMRDCLICYKPFFVPKCKLNRAKYCSRKCKDESVKTQFCPKGHDKDIVGRNKDGICKECVREYDAERYISHPRLPKQFCPHGHDVTICGREKSTKRCKDCIKEWRKAHKDELDAYNKQYQEDNAEQIALQRKEHYENNKKQIIEKISRRTKERKQTDINFKLATMLRERLNVAIRNMYKAGSAVRDLGCPVPFFKDYIAAKFYDGMTWDNWGEVWQLDHINELHTFDLEDREQFLKAVHYTNMQPLTIPDHLKKTLQNRKLKRIKQPIIKFNKELDKANEELLLALKALSSPL